MIDPPTNPDAPPWTTWSQVPTPRKIKAIVLMAIFLLLPLAAALVLSIAGHPYVANLLAVMSGATGALKSWRRIRHKLPDPSVTYIVVSATGAVLLWIVGLGSAALLLLANETTGSPLITGIAWTLDLINGYI
ncbi:MAG: hypothetical protein WCA46_16700, partial [Actinocatenispora sp.]